MYYQLFIKKIIKENYFFIFLSIALTLDNGTSADLATTSALIPCLKRFLIILICLLFKRNYLKLGFSILWRTKDKSA